MSVVRRKLLGPLGARLYEPRFAVSVVEVNAGQILAEAIVGANPWIVEVNEATNRVYVANYAGDSVSMIDGHSNEVIGAIDMGRFRTPGGIAVNERSNRVYIINTAHIGPPQLRDWEACRQRRHRCYRALRACAAYLLRSRERRDQSGVRHQPRGWHPHSV